MLRPIVFPLISDNVSLLEKPGKATSFYSQPYKYAKNFQIYLQKIILKKYYDGKEIVPSIVLSGYSLHIFLN